MENINLTTLIVAIISVAIGVFASKIRPWLKKLFNDNFDEEERKQIKEWINFAVEMAEFIFNESGMGKIKKEKVLEFIDKKLTEIEDALAEHGFEISFDEISEMIDEAVDNMNKKNGK